MATNNSSNKDSKLKEVLFEEEENELSFSLLTGTEGYITLYNSLIPLIPPAAVNYYEKVILFCETNQSIPEYIRSQYLENNDIVVKSNNSEKQSYFRAIFRSPTEINGLVAEEILKGNYDFANTSNTTITSIFQKKETHSKHADIVPVFIDGQVVFVDYTVKKSTEYNISSNMFTTKVINQSNDTDGSFRNIAGVDRKCWFVNLNKYSVRISIGKRYSFAGTSIARSPNDTVYYIEFEIEYNETNAIKNVKKLITKCLETYFTINNLNIIIKNGYDLTIKQVERLDQMFDIFNRNFVSTDYFKNCCSNNCSQLFLAPKWDGVRGFGVWVGQEAIIYTNLGLRTWNNLPVISPQKILFQAEVFLNEVDYNDDFIVTEIFGVAKQSINMLYSIFIRQNMYSGRSVGAGLYNGTITAVTGQLPCTDVRCTYITIKLEHSINVISTLRQKYTNRFTSYIGDENASNTISQILNNNFSIERYHIPTEIKPSKKFGESFVQKGCDGLLGICVFQNGSDGVYIKFKIYQTIELEYDILNYNGKCKSREGTEYIVDGLPTSYNWSNNAYMKRYICLEARFYPETKKLEFIKWRFDKLHPDNDIKIKKIMSSI